MSVTLLVAVAVVTVASRVAALALLPPPPPALEAVVRRLPAPLFAALAALTLTGADAGLTDPPLLAAVGCALVATRWSSLLFALAAGLGGYVVAVLVV